MRQYRNRFYSKTIDYLYCLCRNKQSYQPFSSGIVSTSFNFFTRTILSNTNVLTHE